jgi:hypothetical protein
MRHSYKLVLLFLAALTLSFKPKKAVKEFTLVSATQQATYGGVEGSPIVTRYTIKLKALTAFTMTCDSAYAAGRMDKFIILGDSSQDLDKLKLKKGKVLTIAFDIVVPSETGYNNYVGRFNGSPEVKVPVSSATGVVLRYKGGKSKYFGVAQIFTQPSVYAP